MLKTVKVLHFNSLPVFDGRKVNPKDKKELEWYPEPEIHGAIALVCAVLIIHLFDRRVNICREYQD